MSNGHFTSAPCRNVLGPKCLRSEVSVHRNRGLSKNRRDDGTTTGQDEASLPQLAAISWYIYSLTLWPYHVDGGSTGQRDS